MKKIFFIIVLGLLAVSFFDIRNIISNWDKKQISKIKDLKKETFKCSGEGGTGQTVYATFDIDPVNKTLIFSQSGGLMGSIIEYPKKITYRIKSSSDTEVLTHENTYSWINLAGKEINFISNIYTKDKKTFEYDFIKTKRKNPPYLFSNCKKQ
jgi:hypothetical protein